MSKPTTRVQKSRSQLTKADRVAIKEEQASFIAKINTAEPNQHQEAIFTAARSGQGHYVVLAGPGSGKTFTSIKASTSFTGRAIYFSYNKKIQIDTNAKLVAIDSPMVATTAHAFGLGCLNAFSRGLCRIDDKDAKYHNIVTQYLFEQWPLYLQSIQAELEENEDADVAVMRLDAQSWSEDLIHYAQVSLTEPTAENLARLVNDFDLSDISIFSLVWPFVIKAVAYAIEEGQRQFLAEHLVSFDDMVYLPNAIPGVPVRQYDHVIVDECQDTSRASLELMLKACHARTQFFAVGDPKQNIYRFAGAAEDSIGQIIERLHASILPLKIIYRCGSNIVDLANQLCNEDEKLISANMHQGIVEVIEEYVDRLQAGDAVIGRTRKKLVQGCLKTLQIGKRAKVLGRDIGNDITGVVTRLEAKRIRRGVPALKSDLSNLLELLEEYQQTESRHLRESRKDPEMALSELDDKVETVRAFFEAYIGKCLDESRRVPEDPPCAFNRTAKDFKAYIHGLFSDEDGSKDFILFMTAHKSKGGEWENVYLIGTEEFPHPKAKSDRQQEQESNLMYVAITRAIDKLCFVGAPFKGLKVPGYEPSHGLTIISAPAADHLEIYPTRLDGETVKPSIYDAPGFEDYNPVVVDALLHDFLRESCDSAEDQVFVREVLEKITVLPLDSETVIVEATPELLAEGRVSRIAAIEVLCPACNNPCINQERSAMITYELVGHSVTCSVCRKACIVPLNAFSLQGNVVAREKPAGQAAKREKKGRTTKERKSKAGRKTKGKGVRQPMQLSLDIKVINTLNAMGVNKSELFEELLQQYEPFLDAWAEFGNAEEDDDELDHDEMKDDNEE